MASTLDVTGNLYTYDGTLAQLLSLTVLPSFTSVSGTVSITENDGVLTSGEVGTLSIDGVPQSVDYEGVASFNADSLIGGVLGILLGSTDAAVFTSATGEVYLYAPDGFPVLAGVATTITLDDTASYNLAPSTAGVDGTSGDDVMLVGYTDDDGDQITNENLLFLQSGDDTIYGYAGNDYINAGSGYDTVYGGSGNDTLLGAAGNDVLYGDEGNDSIDGGSGNDLIYGGADDDTITGGLGRDTVYGGDGNDTWLAGGTDSGTDVVYLEGGDDVAEVGYYTPADGLEVLDGGDGNDTIALDGTAVDAFDLGITLNDDGTATNIGFATQVLNFENVRGNSGANAITGNLLDNELIGAGGQDTLSGGGGNDTLDGGADNDTLDGGDGDDILTGGAGADSQTGGAGNDTFIIGSAADANGDVIIGGTGPDDTTDQDAIDLSALDPASYTITAVDDPNDSGAKTGTVNFTTGEVLTFSGIEIICFAQGTEIITADGPTCVEDLAEGDLVMTMDNGYQPVRWLGSKALSAADLQTAPKLRPIRIAAGALGNGTPARDLLVSRQHRVLLRSAIAERMFGVKEVLVAAIKLVGLPGIEIAEGVDGVTYFHILFDRHEIVFSNGAATESLFTGPEALKAVSEDARAEILQLFPDIAEQTERTAARHIPTKGQRVLRLIARHAKNHKALVDRSVA
ncbi:Hint domain-containing protein [Donghicola sp.]|jgi:Ca2+-binding RTX toxin-like protein|uniref:Hint domain-containing protein n=1 Tax=Donghicola sp. TaxID=1929294 RepID=UPI0025D6CD10|nr:Hint domain-containing protein [Donghicola sp.]MCT4579567.1 Hint domain-containing protein [Donghicola sp.]